MKVNPETENIVGLKGSEILAALGNCSLWTIPPDIYLELETDGTVH